MSLVDTSTGEIVVMSEDEAQELTLLIRQTVDIAWSQITRAFQGRAWVALGYLSWDEYCDAEFGELRIKLPREQRREVVATLAESGMSHRAIAAATGLSKNTVTSDLSQTGTPDDRTVIGTDDEYEAQQQAHGYDWEQLGWSGHVEHDAMFSTITDVIEQLSPPVRTYLKRVWRERHYRLPLSVLDMDEWDRIVRGAPQVVAQDEAAHYAQVAS